MVFDLSIRHACLKRFRARAESDVQKLGLAASHLWMVGKWGGHAPGLRAPAAPALCEFCACASPAFAHLFS